MNRHHNPPRQDAKQGSNWSSLSTEGRLSASRSLDGMSTEQTVELLLTEDRRGLEAALRQRQSIAEAADRVADTLEAGHDVVFIGAGTSGRLGVLEAAECPPTFGTDPQRLRAAIAGGPEAVFCAREGSEDRAEDGREVARGLCAGDLLIGLSASSVTPYVRGALAEAGHHDVATILLTCATAEGLDGEADLVVALATGPEVLTGSTRLKAGSATKAALNAITTAAMVRLGKVFDNLMVDLRPGSAKLVDRALRIVEIAGQISRTEAEKLYRDSDGEVKTAIVMARCKTTVSEARQRLADSGGHVRAALEAS